MLLDQRAAVMVRSKAAAGFSVETLIATPPAMPSRPTRG
jgi:hypothetical protein